MRKRIVSLLMALVMAFSLIPTTVLAAGHDDQVHVVVENTTFHEADGAAWEGKLVDKWVDLDADSTMMSCVEKALEPDYKAEGAESGYIKEINELKAGAKGGMSGWMGTLNDWFVNEGFDKFTVANGKLTAGDEIRVMYSCTADDLGGTWDNQDKTVKELTISGAALSPAFDKDTHEYTLTIDKDTTSVVVTPTASNKNYQVRTSVDGKEYKRGAAIPVSDGTVITVKCGDHSWPSMNANTGEAQIYTITVKQEGSASDATTANVTIRSQMAGGYLHGFAEPVEVASDLADRYGFTDSVDGVSALDVLVKAHEITFGEDFTPDTASSFLVVSQTGFITTIFGEKTGNCGFTINGKIPHNGILTEDNYAPGKKSYTGYTVAQAKVTTGDTVEFFLYQDSSALDNYSLWERNGISLNSLTVKPEAAVDITVKGYCIGYYGCVPMDALVENGQVTALGDAQLAWVDTESGSLTDIENAVVDEDGNVSFTAPATAGTYYLAAYMPADKVKDEFATPVIMSILPVTVDENAPDLEGVQSVTFTGMHSAQLDSLKVYSYTDGVKGDVDLLDGVEAIAVNSYGAKKYETKLPVGDYLVEGYDANNDTCNGTIVITVKEGENTFELCRAYQIYATNSGWVDGTDYTISVKVTGSDGTVRQIQTGKAISYGTQYTTCLFMSGDTVEATFTPIGDKANDYLPLVVSKSGNQTTSQAIDLNGSVPQKLNVTVVAPAGSTVSVGVFSNNYSYLFADPESTKENGETIETTFAIPIISSGNHFVRVQHPNGVTYWSFDKWTSAKEITVTKDDLHIGDSSFTKDTVYRFDKNVYDKADVYLTVNRQGYMDLPVGQSFELDVFRNWQAIESAMNQKIALPDVHYRVIDVNGNDSDILTITTDAHNSALASVTANKTGTAIVLVTYDAMTYVQGMGGKELSAIWPEFTGVFVVSVGADGSAIQTNTFIDRPGITVTQDEQKYLDAEHDILFYLGSEGASYSFTPEAGTTVTVARSTVGSTMTFKGFTSDGVSVAANGEVTVSGLTTGRHIIRVEKDGLAAYQVVTARGVSYVMKDADGNELAANAELKPGDKVTIQFSGLVSPKEKMARIYNHNFSMYYLDADGNAFQSKPGSNFGVYDFSGNPVRQLIEITVPTDAEGYTYTLNGAIKVGGFGGALPSHRGVSYTRGMTGVTGTAAAGVLAQLPELTLKLTGWAASNVERLIDAIDDVTLDSGAAIDAAREAYESLSDAQKSQVNNYDKLTAAETKLAEQQNKAVKNVEDLIDAIGDVTFASESAVTAAREAYAALPSALQSKVSNYEKLTAAEAKLTALDLESIYKTTGDYLVKRGTPVSGSIGGEWLALGLARSGRSVPNVDDYYASVVAYVEKYADAQEHLDNKSTESARIILALTAIGKDVTNVGGHDLLKGLNSMDYIKTQSVNGPVWTLLALDSYNYAVSGDVTRDELVKAILDTQLSDGSWPVMKSKKTADIDMTAMAIQALAPYYSKNGAVKTAVDNALTFLSGAQTQDGGFAESVGGTNSSESAAQVLVALCAMKIDPLTDSRFIKSNHTVLDALCSYYVTGGGFKHDAAGSEINAMATEQGYYALAAYFRMKAKQTFLYDMSDVKVICAEGNHRGSWTVVKAATCTEDGTEKRICTVCGAEETRTIKAKGHTFGEWTVTKKATCTENGSQKHVCTACGAEETQTIKALGHKFGEWVVTKEATRTEKGLKTRTCETCGATETEVIPARGNRPGTGKPTDTVKSSQTGDNSQMTLWMGGVLLSAAALVVLNRKKKHSED